MIFIIWELIQTGFHGIWLEHIFQLLQKIIHFSSFFCFGIRNCQNSTQFLSRFIFGHLNTGQEIRNYQNHIPHNV